MNFRKAVAVFVSVALLAFGVCALGCTKSNESVIRETVTKKFDKYKDVDNATLAQIAKTAENEGLQELGISGTDFARAVVDGFDYRINSVTINDNKATANVTIISKSSTDFENRLSEAARQFLASDEAKNMTSAEKAAKIGELAMQTFKQTPTIEENVNIDFELQGNTWVATDATENLSNLDSLIFSSR